MDHLSVLSFGPAPVPSKTFARLSLRKLATLARTSGLDPSWEAIGTAHKFNLADMLVRIKREYEAFILQVASVPLGERTARCVAQIETPRVFPSPQARRRTQRHFPGAARRAKRVMPIALQTQRAFAAMVSRALRASVHIVPSGSGVCIDLSGEAGDVPLMGCAILSCAHCVARDGDDGEDEEDGGTPINRVGRCKSVVFADGTLCLAQCVAADDDADCALLRIVAVLRAGSQGGATTPTCSLAPCPAPIATPVVCIGNPFDWDLEAEDDGRAPTPLGFEPFMLSCGTIEAVREEGGGEEEEEEEEGGEEESGHGLGGTQHGCWTYWGHSGGALLDVRGDVVAMHNSWDPESPIAQRHAVSHTVIETFLESLLVQSGNPNGARRRGDSPAAAINALDCLDSDDGASR